MACKPVAIYQKNREKFAAVGDITMDVLQDRMPSDWINKQLSMTTKVLAKFNFDLFEQPLEVPEIYVEEADEE